VHLSDEGRKQAEQAARRLARLPRVAAIYSSPLERARETAAPIAKLRGLTVNVERALSDLDVGTWTGMSLARVRRRREWTTVQRHPSGFAFPEGESFAEMQARMTTALAELVARHRGATIVAVSHADPIKAVAAQAVGAPLDVFQRIVIGPASITAIAYSDHGPLVLTLNSVDGDVAWLAGR
jgi:probable phosphoglycerate mutase